MKKVNPKEDENSTEELVAAAALLQAVADMCKRKGYSATPACVLGNAVLALNHVITASIYEDEETH